MDLFYVPGQTLGQTFYGNVSRIATSKADHLVQTLKEDTWDVLNALWEDAREKVEPFLLELKYEDFLNLSIKISEP
jgi:hypothetical protein